MSGSFADQGHFGLSSIGLGRSGAPGAPPLSPTPLFGGEMGIQTGWNLEPVPEHPVTLVSVIGLAIVLLRPGDRTEMHTESSDSPSAR